MEGCVGGTLVVISQVITTFSQFSEVDGIEVSGWNGWHGFSKVGGLESSKLLSPSYTTVMAKLECVLPPAYVAC